MTKQWALTGKHLAIRHWPSSCQVQIVCCYNIWAYISKWRPLCLEVSRNSNCSHISWECTHVLMSELQDNISQILYTSQLATRCLTFDISHSIKCIVQSVKFYHGGLKYHLYFGNIWLSTQSWYPCAQYTKHQQVRLVLLNCCFPERGLFGYVIYSCIRLGGAKMNTMFE